VSGYVVAPAGFQHDVAVVLGPRLLSGIGYGSGLSQHRQTWPEPRVLHGKQLLDLLHHAEIRGRGGAGFPFARKFQTTLESGKRRAVVVNAAEGEPGSAKDSALILTAPHLILDGAEIVARALNVKSIQIMVPSERTAVRPALERALDERSPEVRYTVFETEGTFLSGQSFAVTEAIEGRANLPVTSWQPQAVKGLRGRPTALSNAETFAQVAALAAMGPERYSAEGTPEEPGTTLITIAGDGPGGVVMEVPLGTPLADVLQLCGYEPDVTVLIGGYFGTWLAPHEVATRLLSRVDMAAAGAASERASSCHWTATPARWYSPPGSWSTWPGRAPGGAAPASTGCRPWPRRWPCWPTEVWQPPPAGSTNWPTSSTAGAPARTPTEPSDWCDPC
jgi:hypothetical protein